MQGQKMRFDEELARIQAANTAAKQELSGAANRASQVQRQKLLQGAATPGAPPAGNSDEAAVSTSQGITEGAATLLERQRVIRSELVGQRRTAEHEIGMSLQGL